MRNLLTLLFASCVLGVSAQEDMTNYIVNPSFEQGGLANWTVSGLAAQGNSLFKDGNGNQLREGSTYAEKWVASGNSVGNASAVQTVKYLPLGKYTLTVAAQNLDQSDKSKKCTGAYIYAVKTSNKTSVYTPDNYSIDFVNTKGSVEIGFVASSASGNWLAVDNFRLVKTGELDGDDLQTIITQIASLVTKAEGLTASLMSKEASTALAEAIALGKAVNEASSAADVSAAYTSLNTAIDKANVSIQAFKNVTTKLNTALGLASSTMQTTVKEALDNAIALAQALSGESHDEDVQKASDALDKSIADANESIAAYTALKNEIEKSAATLDETKKEWEALKAVITEAETMYSTCEAGVDDVNAMVTRLEKAVLAFNIANATSGTGTAPKVSSTNTYVLTGATQALMRATFSGTNSLILEKGVCWSTEHNPTVLDDRTTEAWTLNGAIYHLSGLKQATVYYLRPYVMSKTYQVAYGTEVKIVTHKKGNCTWSWNEGAPDAAANDRCRTAIKQTIDYFNEWTGINGFHLSGSYGSGTPTADCSYGGSMRIGPNAAYQAIGTVLHETGHGVGVGTSGRYWDENLHSWKWYGREANKIYSFLENKEADPYNSDFCMVGDGTHAWGASASYDWFVNGADKDKHIELQYVGGCCLLYGMFIDGLCPTYSYSNGIAGYTFNFDETKKYYLMSTDANAGLNTCLLTASGNSVSVKECIAEGAEIPAEAAFMVEYDAQTGKYHFKNVAKNRYLSTSTYKLANVEKAGDTEKFQLMPARLGVTLGTTIKKLKTYGYWIYNNNSLAASGVNKTASFSSFDFTDKATKQQWAIISEDELVKYWKMAEPSGIEKVTETATDDRVLGIYSLNGARLPQMQKGINIIRYANGTAKKIIK